MPQSSICSLLTEFKYSYTQGNCKNCLSDLYSEKQSILTKMQFQTEAILPFLPQKYKVYVCQELSKVNAAQCHPDLSYNSKVHHGLEKQRKRKAFGTLNSIFVHVIYKNTHLLKDVYGFH